MKNLLWYLYGYVYDGLLLFRPYSKLVADVCAQVEAKDGDTILDLGCGTGNIINSLKDKNLVITGVDNSKSMLLVARRKLSDSKAEVKLVRGDVYEFTKNYHERPADWVVLCNSVYALDKDSRLGMWREIKRITKPGAKIVIANPDRLGSGPLIDYHLRQGNFLSLLRPKLLAVWVVDKLIDMFARRGTFTMQTYNELKDELTDLGKPSLIGRTYGDEKTGIDLLITVQRT